MHLYDEHNDVLRIVFSNIGAHLLGLDKEQSECNEMHPYYTVHRKYVNEMLRPLNFVVGVNHFDRHCIMPLVGETK